MPLGTKKIPEDWFAKYIYKENIKWEECEKLIEKIKFLNKIRTKNIQNYFLSLTNYLIKQLKHINFDILEKNERSYIVICKRKDKDNRVLHQKILEKEVKISLREDYLRILSHFYNTMKNILVGALTYLIK